MGMIGAMLMDTHIIPRHLATIISMPEISIQGTHHLLIALKSR